MSVSDDLKLGMEALRRIAGLRYPPPPTWVPDALEQSLVDGEVNTPLRLAHYLGQTCWESAGWSAFEEPDFAAKVRPYGILWKGRGAIQITWERNYRALAIALDEPRLISNPELVAMPEWAFRSAAWYWKSNNLNALADVNDVAALSRAINGPRCSTMTQRLALTDRAHRELMTTKG